MPALLTTFPNRVLYRISIQQTLDCCWSMWNASPHTYSDTGLHVCYEFLSMSVVWIVCLNQWSFGFPDKAAL